MQSQNMKTCRMKFRDQTLTSTGTCGPFNPPPPSNSWISILCGVPPFSPLLQIPTKYAPLPRLLGRATVEMKVTYVNNPEVKVATHPVSRNDSTQLVG